MARKMKYDQDFPLRAKDLARRGLNDREIAAKLGIGKTTLYVYETKYPEFRDAIKEGKAPVDVEIENVLLKKARGYEYEETTIEYATGAEKEDAKNVSPKKVKKQIKLMAPDTAAIIFWLKNRRPKLWRDKQNLELSGEDGEPVKIEYIPVKKKKDKENDNKTD